jgi:Ca-activated chloride channel homolog
MIMTKRKYINKILLLLFVFGTFTSFAQSSKKLVREGNNKYEDGDFSDAEVQYRKALTKDPNYYKGKFNLGDAMYQQKNYKESGKIFDDLAQRKLDPNAKSGVYYNLGNSLMSEKKYQDAIEAYKNSLRLKPDDPDAKYNLEYARKKLSEQQKQQQQNKDQNKDKDKNKDKNKQDQQNKDQNKNDKQKDKDKQDQQQQDKQDKQDQKDKQNQDQNKQDQGDQNKQQQQQNQPQQISKADAQKMLEALKNDEKKTLQALQKQKAKAAKGKKTDIDW